MGNKNPAHVAVSRVGKSYGSYDRITCLPKVYRGCYTRTYAISGPPIDSGWTSSRRPGHHDVSLFRAASPALSLL